MQKTFKLSNAGKLKVVINPATKKTTLYMSDGYVNFYFGAEKYFGMELKWMRNTLASNLEGDDVNEVFDYILDKVI